MLIATSPENILSCTFMLVSQSDYSVSCDNYPNRESDSLKVFEKSLKKSGRRLHLDLIKSLHLALRAQRPKNATPIVKC